MIHRFASSVTTWSKLDVPLNVLTFLSFHSSHVLAFLSFHNSHPTRKLNNQPNTSLTGCGSLWQLSRWRGWPFGLPHIRFIRLIFSAGTMFFSHNNSARTVFFSQFQPKFRPANGAYGCVHLYGST